MVESVEIQRVIVNIKKLKLGDLVTVKAEIGPPAGHTEWRTIIEDIYEPLAWKSGHTLKQHIVEMLENLF